MAEITVNRGTNPLVRPSQSPSTLVAWILLAVIFAAVYLASLPSPPLMDDVDSSHAQAAQYIADTGDWISPRIDGIRYIEKPPLPYWLVAIVYRVTGKENALTTHLPNALAMLALAWLCWLWARHAWGDRAGLYAALGVLVSIGPFIYTRFIIPEAILALFLLAALYGLITGLEMNRPTRFYLCWAGVALALMTKGLIAPVFFLGAAIPYLWLTGQWRRWREFKPASGLVLFLLIAAPWHILCGIVNHDQGHPVGNHPTFGNVHGFFYFYFINEHVLRFFNLRYPHDYNKLPAAIYWLAHLAWLFPWSIFLPAVFALAWKTRRRWLEFMRDKAGLGADSSLAPSQPGGNAFDCATEPRFRARTIWLLSLFTAWTLLFFSISTNQEYYTFPVWPPLFMLIAGVVAGIEEGSADDGGKPLVSTAWLTGAQAALTVIGALAALVLFWGLWTSRHLPYVADIGTLLAHRGVGDYTLSMSHLFDLTGASFAALRLPAALAAVAFLIGPAASWILRLRSRHLAATLTLAVTFSVFLIAAHIAFARFSPMLSSEKMAETIRQKGSPSDTFIIDGEQSDGSSVIFYTHGFLRGLTLIVAPQCGQHGEGSTLLWGSCYPDAPRIDIGEDELSRIWGTGNRKWLFAQDVNQTKAEQLLAGRLYPVQTLADKALWTDRPLP
jgi:4-amino-4-deoxy-L-arabinose transferase-like glycosyltransferase